METKNKTLSELINETQNKIIDVLNESMLAPEILGLIMSNISLSIQTQVKQSPSPIEMPTETKEN